MLSVGCQLNFALPRLLLCQLRQEAHADVVEGLECKCVFLRDLGNMKHPKEILGDQMAEVVLWCISMAPPMCWHLVHAHENILRRHLLM